MLAVDVMRTSFASIRPTANVLDAVNLLLETNQRGLPVVNDDGNLVGIVSERDYARKVVLKGRSSADTPVRDIMTRAVIYVGPQEDNERCMALMTERRLRHLPVLEHGKLIGLISIGDLVKDIISEQQFIISQLESYITGERA